jgi:peptide/nickel transport system permease protein
MRQVRLLPVAALIRGKAGSFPASTTALCYAASIARQMRSNMLEVIRQDYITTARAKGQTERKVLYSHALQNAIIPIIMTVGSTFGMAMGGSLVTEVIFGIPGWAATQLTH